MYIITVTWAVYYILYWTFHLVLSDCSWQIVTHLHSSRRSSRVLERVRNSDPSLTTVEEGSNRVDREKGEKRKRETAKNSDLCWALLVASSSSSSTLESLQQVSKYFFNNSDGHWAGMGVILVGWIEVVSLQSKYRQIQLALSPFPISYLSDSHSRAGSIKNQIRWALSPC